MYQELNDIQADPVELQNLIDAPSQARHWSG